MKTAQKIKKFITCMFASCLVFVTTNVCAEDLLAQALTGDVSDTFSSQGIFWKVFILVDVILATAMAVKTKNPMVFIGVAAVAFIPGFLIKTLVF